ncbi:MAG: DUF3089 domain-containing protein, partial [Lachnospirales bacterium]
MIYGKKFEISLVFMVLSLLIFTGCTYNNENSLKYDSEDMWAYCDANGDKYFDCFLICPTVYFGDENNYNMSIDDSKTKESFLGALNMEKGIYDLSCNMFSPYYRQASLSAYKIAGNESEKYFDIAYKDVKNSFEYYLDNYNNGKPIVIAGFSQGGDMSIRLMKDFYNDEDIQNKIVACYAIGWRLTEDEINKYPYLKAASCEDDTGVIVTFNTESKDVNSSIIVPIKTLSINPLNWKTDSTYAPNSLNKGACFTDYEGNINKEILNLTGAYIDSNRGTLKVDDNITPKDYP